MNVLNLKTYRERANYTQLEVAEKLDVSQPCYSRWEKGNRLPDAHQILKLCDIFECTPNDLFGFKGTHVVAITDLKYGNDKE